MDFVLYHLDSGAPAADLVPEPPVVLQDDGEAQQRAA